MQKILRCLSNIEITFRGTNHKNNENTVIDITKRRGHKYSQGSYEYISAVVIAENQLGETVSRGGASKHLEPRHVLILFWRAGSLCEGGWCSAAWPGAAGAAQGEESAGAVAQWGRNRSAMTLGHIVLKR